MDNVVANQSAVSWAAFFNDQKREVTVYFHAELCEINEVHTVLFIDVCCTYSTFTLTYLNI